jgi:hypothetical protein
MKKIVTYELEHKEKVALNMAANAKRKLDLAYIDWESAIGHCVSIGLPLRLIGEHAGCSSAKISRTFFQDGERR